MAFKDPTICIKDIEYPVRFGHRCINVYAVRTGKISLANINASEFYEYYYSAIVAGCNRNKIPEPTYDEYMNALDDQPDLFDQISVIRVEQESSKKEMS